MNRDLHVDKVIEDYWALKESPFFPFEEGEGGLLLTQEERENARKKLDQIRAVLNNFSQEYVSLCKQNFTDQIGILIDKLDNPKLGYPLSRNQGLIVDNAVYSNFIQSLANSLKFNISHPPTLIRTSQKKDILNPEPLRSLLKKYKDLLETNQYRNYSEIEEVADSLMEEITALWKSENKIYKQYQH